MQRMFNIDYEDHAISVVVDCDWGGPCEYTPYCMTCPWRGTTVGDVLHLDGSGKLGNQYDAFAEALEHAGVSIDQYVDDQEEVINIWLKSIVQATEAINKARANIAGMRGLTD